MWSAAFMEKLIQLWKFALTNLMTAIDALFGWLVPDVAEKYNLPLSGKAQWSIFLFVRKTRAPEVSK